MAISAQTRAAFLRVVVDGHARRGPRAAVRHLGPAVRATVRMITSIAKVARPAAIPVSCMSGIDEHHRDGGGDARRRSGSRRALPKWLCAMNAGRSGWKIAFWSTGMTKQPGRVGADRGEADVPEREDARVPDEDVQADDEHQVDQRRRRRRRWVTDVAGRPGDRRRRDDQHEQRRQGPRRPEGRPHAAIRPVSRTERATIEALRPHEQHRDHGRERERVAVGAQLERQVRLQRRR